ncbi:TIGR03086 family metal-binding protein [Nocardioides sp. GXQ0305]|uniref:TIGR03086 family metal-binding protein n=1 Tax=Nocardioides sp. GXQ0305 TaxID=3423912 RepID=UPI003D7E08B1
MTLALAGAVELLERSLAYTGSALALVTPDRLGDPTPCAEWDLAELLHHMDDALDAFTEAAAGEVSLVPTDGVPRLESIRTKACALLGWWVAHPPDDVRVGDLALPAGLLVGAAALEITTHGWDVHQAIGTRRPLPEELAEQLLGVAALTVGDDDRPHRFAAPRPVPVGATASRRLLAHLGRG